MDQEEWLPVPGFEPFYEVSDQGRVRRLYFLHFTAEGKEYWIPRYPYPRIIKGRVDRFGYPALALRKDHKIQYFRVHQLVALAFIGPAPSSDHEIHHGDGSRSNNQASNLEWLTHKEHKQRHKKV